MDRKIDVIKLRDLSQRDLALHLRELSDEHSTLEISACLLSAIEQEALSPTVYHRFLSATKSPCPLLRALRQEFSGSVRHAAIKEFGTRLKQTDWEAAWRDIGGVPSLISLLEDFSVAEVKSLCKVIASSHSASHPLEKRALQITELLQSLCPHFYPESRFKSTDQRPLRHHYAKMIPACSSAFVIELICTFNHPLQRYIKVNSIMKYHFDALRTLVLDLLRSKSPVSDVMAEDLLKHYLPPLLQDMPPSSGLEPHFSAPMSFAVTVLKTLAVQEVSDLPAQRYIIDEIFLGQLTIPLVRRLSSHKVKNSRVVQILDLAVQKLQRDEHLRSGVVLYQCGSLMSLVAHFWCHDAAKFEAPLNILAGLWHTGLTSDFRSNLRSYIHIIKDVARSRRYALFQLLCKHGSGAQDITSDQGLKTLNVQTWPIELFYILRPEDSFSLLDRLLQLYDKEKVLEFAREMIIPRPTILDSSTSRGSSHSNAKILCTHLQRGQSNCKAQAHDVINTAKAKAQTSRDQSDRAFFAQTAVFLAIASGSLELYHGVVKWKRQFLGDYHTMRTIYATDTCNTIEGIALLVGIPDDLHDSDESSIHDRILKANGILMTYLDSAVTCLREPSFNQRDWISPLSLFREIVINRSRQAGRLKSQLQLTEDKLYDLLWAETLDMLLRAERVGLQPGHEALQFNSSYGPLGFATVETNLEVKPKLPSTFLFLDKMAQARDKLWQDVRLKKNPAVMTLEPLWPRGLPVQCLTGTFSLVGMPADHPMTFLISRASKVVMAEPSLALAHFPRDEETARAVERFIDHFGKALEIHVLQRTRGIEREGLIYEAYLHATTSLSVGRLDEGEAQAFWKPIFRQALPGERPGFLKIEDQCVDPAIPNVSDPAEVFEWDATSSLSRIDEPRVLDLTVLDCMLKIPLDLRCHGEKVFRESRSTTQTLRPLFAWSSQRLLTMRTISTPAREALIAFALLAISSDIQGPSKILKAPFPSPNTLRYPAMFLDEGSLRKFHDFSIKPTAVLYRLVPMVPPTLILSLAKSAMDVLSTTQTNEQKLTSVMRTAFRLIQLLSKSDRPHLASKLILDAVISFPDASSWHRELLTKSFIRSLGTDQAQSFISLLASSIRDKLTSQASLPDTKTGNEPAETKRPFVKVTTVKFLAQFMDDADFFPPHETIEVLIQIFHASSHIDIRVAVIDTMLKKLGALAGDGSDLSNDLLTEKLLSALETATPVIGNLNERRPIRTSDWEAAEETGNLPKVYDDGGVEAVPPLLQLVISAIASNSISSVPLRRRLIQKILVPVIERSQIEQTRWMRMFMKQYSPSQEPFSFPVLPAKPVALVRLLQGPYSDVPRHLLKIYRIYFDANTNPSQSLQALISNVYSKPDLRSSNAGSHLLSLYGGRLVFEQLPVATNSLTHAWSPSVLPDDQRIHPSDMQSLAFDQAIVLLKQNDTSFRHWVSYMNTLSAFPQWKNQGEIEAWLANAKPVVQRIVDHVDSLRTLEWQRSKNRNPAVLPDTFSDHLWLLPYPHFYPLRTLTDLPLQVRVRKFARSIMAVLEGIVKSGLTHHSRLCDVKTAATRCHCEDRILVALDLGMAGAGRDTVAGEKENDASMSEVGENDESSTSVVIKILTAELIEELLQEIDLKTMKTEEEAVARLREMLEVWTTSEVEAIRMAGMRLMKKLFPQ